jgi:[ribosomal protein S18]-alanine N-acetyltransferase
VTTTIRQANAGDVPGIWAVERAVFGSILYPEFFFRQALDLWPDMLLLAELPEAGVAGYALTAPSQQEGEGWILSVAVHPERRGGGIGRALIEGALQALADRDYHVVRITVHPENRAAAHLYESMGFVSEGVRSDHFGPGEPRRFMRLTRSA